LPYILILIASLTIGAIYSIFCGCLIEVSAGPGASSSVFTHRLVLLWSPRADVHRANARANGALYKIVQVHTISYEGQAIQYSDEARQSRHTTALVFRSLASHRLFEGGCARGEGVHCAQPRP